VADHDIRSWFSSCLVPSTKLRENFKSAASIFGPTAVRREYGKKEILSPGRSFGLTVEDICVSIYDKWPAVDQ
jgi:hypothetical protein